MISQSFGATENTFPGFRSGNYSSLLDLRYAYQDALAHGVTVLAASGDEGVTNDNTAGSLYPYPVNSWPSSDPLVTSVGGSMLSLDQAGHHVTPDAVWNDGYGVGGGGTSAVFPRPSVPDRRGQCRRQPPGDPGHLDDRRGQWRLLGLHVLRGHRVPRGQRPGLVHLRGDLRSHPDLLRHRRPGRPDGWAPPREHQPGALHSRRRSTPYLGSATGIVDITTGNNSFGGVTGYQATPGYDLASGWGTIDANKFVRALARF